MNHREYVALQERVERWYWRAFVFVVPSMKAAALLVALRLARPAFGLHVQSRATVGAAVAALWLWWAWRRLNEPPITDLGDSIRRRIVATAADERGHCMNRHCSLCGGKSPLKGGA